MKQEASLNYGVALYKFGWVARHLLPWPITSGSSLAASLVAECHLWVPWRLSCLTFRLVFATCVTWGLIFPAICMFVSRPCCFPSFEVTPLSVGPVFGGVLLDCQVSLWLCSLDFPFPVEWNALRGLVSKYICKRKMWAFNSYHCDVEN